MSKRNLFQGRSLCEISDFTREERRYLFEKTRVLKKAFEENDRKTLDTFRINDRDFGIYEVFLENSTRTKESFRNAANFQLVKVEELNVSSSSFNKGESYADTFHMLSGYYNNIFIVRSKTEGLCRHLEQDAKAYAERNNLQFVPAFVNAGDGKHEHPTQELLDEFSFLEDNGFDYSSIHVALVGDLYHGRTVHSKVDGLKLFDSVKVDLIAPEELAMPDNYVVKMRENGFTVRVFNSIGEYLEQKDVSDIWYFTRPQLERMGDRILRKADQLREGITFKREFLPLLKPGTRFYHPLPRHKMHPTIPTFLDDTPINGWERQSINGMYVRITLLSLIGGKIGWDYEGEEKQEVERANYIEEVDLSGRDNAPKRYSEGVHPIHDGIVIDHILRGSSPHEIREHMRLVSRVLDLETGRGGDWISCGHKGEKSFKGILFRPESREFSRKDLKRLAAVCPGCTLNIIKDGRVFKKFRMHMPPRIYNFDDLCCLNEACISNPAEGEGVSARFYRTSDNRFACAYCGKSHTFKEIWK